jgi:large subunit ribosomal protein L2
MLKKSKPTSAGRRFVTSVSNQELHKGGPLKSLTVNKSKTAGRNNAGRITVRHRGGCHKQKI